VTTGRYFVNP
jgi:hypothetical protein